MTRWLAQHLRTAGATLRRIARSPIATLFNVLVVGIALALPFSPLAHTLGFTRLPLALVGVIIAIIPTYLLVLELGKRVFYRRLAAAPHAAASRRPPHEHRILRRAARWSHRRALA
jgi:Mg2+-importing ATPase